MFFNKSAKRLLIVEAELLEVKSALLQSSADLDLARQNIHKLTHELTLSRQDVDMLLQKNEELSSRYAVILDIEKAVIEKRALVAESESDLMELNRRYLDQLKIYKELEESIKLFEENLEVHSYGLYQPKYNFEFPEQYKLELESIYQQQKRLIAEGLAVKCNTDWVVGGSAAAGQKMTRHYSKLMLYAFNGECDAIIAKVNWNNVTRMDLRIRNAFQSINKLGESHNITITAVFMDLKLKELALNYEYEQKRNEAKEEQRRIREQMREEEKAQKEFERAQREAEDEERRYQRALDRTREELDMESNPSVLNDLNEKIIKLESMLQAAHDRKERAISLAQLTKVGHIYIISNIGSFGENVFKIGMTRRMDPQDRVKELGDASVPFHFDVHAIIYSENAPQLEYELHQQFKDRRINQINQRKEFFRVSLDEIEAFICNHTKAQIAFTKLAEAREYRETKILFEKLENSLPTS